MKTSVNNLKEIFLKATKRVLKENISTNPETLSANLNLITNSYNNLVVEIAKNWKLASEVDKKFLKEVFVYVREKLVKSYTVLNCNFYIPTTIYNIINPLVIQKTQSESVEDYSSDDSSELYLNSIFQDCSGLPFGNSHIDNLERKSSLSTTSLEINTNMSFTKIDLLKLVSTTINKNYSGDPLGLQSFIDSVNLLSAFATSNELKDILIKSIISKLEGTARDCITNNPDSVDQIIVCLTSKIKTESSKVLEGRMQALRTDRTSLQDFSKRAEELAENFKRSLVMEGISCEKAMEMTIDKTVEMCRSSARSDLVKSVLASTKFSDPKEVVAKFIVEINNDNKERHVLTFRSNQRKPNSPNYNHNNQYRQSNYNRFHKPNNQTNNYRQNQTNYRPNYTNPRNPPNYTNSNNFTNSYRRDGQGHRPAFNTTQRPNQNRHNVRYLENSNAPQWRQDQNQLGEDNH